MFPRTDADKALGVIRLRLGDQEYILPTLPWEASDDWQIAARAVIDEHSKPQMDTPGDVLTVVSSGMGEVANLVAAYDVQHKLGKDVAALKRTFDKTQIYSIFKAICGHEFPFVTDAQTLMEVAWPRVQRMILDVMVALSRSPNSSNGRSHTGDSTPEASDPALTIASSSSSGTPDSSG